MNRGAVALLQAGEPACATTLAIKMIESFTSRSTPSGSKNPRANRNSAPAVDAALSKTLSDLSDTYIRCRDESNHGLGPDDDGGEKIWLPQLLIFLRAACKFAAGTPSLHARYARALTAAGQDARASKHFALANIPQEYAASLKVWATKGFASEKDLFFARAVLHMLTIPGKEAQAAQLYQALGAPSMTPVDNIVSMLLELLDMTTKGHRVGREGGKQSFAVLREMYGPILRLRDHRTLSLFDRVGQVQFHWDPPRSAMQSMMQNVMKMFDPQP
uniref:Uncharacterized protein n=1 Tax=Octactis speculum TaxID=3111310 RepID=A0A7S2ANH1_9STRA